MRLTTKLLGLALALAFVAAPAMAQQGEGTGGDFSLATQRNADLPSDADKFLCVGDAFTIQFSSGTIMNSPVALFADIAPVHRDINEDIGGLGLGIGTGINRFVIFNSISDPLQPSLVGGMLTQSYIVPASQDWIDGGIYAANPDAAVAADNAASDDWGFFAQGVTLDPGGPLGVQLSNTVKHEIGNELADMFSNTCEDALQCAGLGEADLGVPFTVDTSLYTNNTAINAATLATTTVFTVGAGTIAPAVSNPAFPDLNNRDAFITFTAGFTAEYNFSLCGSSFDTGLAILDTDCVTGLITNDDNNPVCGSGFRSYIGAFPMTMGQTVVIMVDGYSGGGTSLNEGLAELIITRNPLFSVTSQDLNNGDIAGGELLTFTGTALDTVVSVTVGGNAATGLTPTGTTMLTVTVPAGVVGPADIVLTDGADVVTITGGWLYVDNALPTFSECSTPAIAFGPTNAQDTLVVSAGVGATIAAGTLTVDLDITHTWLSDLTIDLTAPDGVTVFNLWDGDGGSNDDLIGTYPTGVNPSSGTPLIPSGNGDFSELDGTSPDGTWTLDIVDAFPGSDDGVLNMWCVNGQIEYAAASGMSAPGTPISTGAANSIQDTIVIIDDTTIGSMTVDVDISHTWVGDLEIDVTSPALTTVRLIDNQFGNTANLIGTYPGGTNMGQTAFALDPLGAGDFSEFFGETTAGNWVMDINDTAFGDGGALNSWGVNFN